VSTLRSTQDRELLQTLCAQHGVKPEVVEELLKIEKEYQLKQRRVGIYDRLKECVESSINPEERRD